MKPLRRLLLRGSAVAPLLPLLGSGLLMPTRVLAAEWNRAAFSARQTNDALKAYAAGTPQESREITINAPEIAENGAKVEIEVSTTLAGAQRIAVFADKNPYPLCAALDFAPPALPFVKLQAKLAESTRLRAVVRTADGKHHVAFRDVKVTLGGCGG
jgi:sulfur-oxidizing protein SoxY